MSKIIYATYIDNQKEIGYPIEFLIEQNPHLSIFCSDTEQHDYLFKQEIDAYPIGIKIKTPADIATAQNKCIDYLFEKMKPDFVVWQQADTLITEEGYDIIKTVCVAGNEHKSYALNNRHIRLFHLCHMDYFGITIFGRDHKERFVGDGAYTNYTGNYPESRLGELGSIDIGYLTIEQCRKHLAQHGKTWGKGNPYDNLETDEEFVECVLKRSDVLGLAETENIYYELFRKMGLLQENERVKEMAKNLKLSTVGRLINV